MGEGEGKEPVQAIEKRPWLWAAPFFLLALVVAFSGLSSDRAWPVAALLLAGIVIAVVPAATWKEMLANVENAQFGPISVGLRQQLGKAATKAESDAEAGDGDDSDIEVTGMLDLRMKLEWKLTYVAKHLLAEGGSPTFLTIGSLRYDGYLTEEDAATAAAILTTREEELRELSEKEQKKFLEQGEEFVDGVRAAIFWGQVRRCLWEGRKPGRSGDLLRDLKPSSGRREDFLAGPAGKEHRVTTAFAIDERSKIIGWALQRLERERAASVGGERQIVVVPDISHVKETDPAAKPRVVKLANLRKVLEEA